MTSPSPTPRPTPRRAGTRARWAVPGVVAVAVAAAFGAPPLLAAAGDDDLPAVTPAELLADVAAAEPTPLSGTVVYTARLGLPELPVTEATGADPLALLSGSSTLRVWSDGADRSRVALLGAASEYSVVRDGPEAWTYSSTDDEAVHYVLSAADRARYDQLADAARSGAGPAADLPTPQEAADTVLAQASAHSDVTVDAPSTVAGRSVYQLVVSPTDDGTLVDRVVVAVDAETSVPLRVQVWGTADTRTPALEVGYTDVSYDTPSDAVLAFSAPAGASVRDVEVPLPTAEDAPAAHDGTLPDGVSVTGTGWTAVTQWTGLDVAGLVAGDPSALSSVPGTGPTIGSDSAQDLIGEFAGEDGAHGGFDLDTSALYDQLTTDVPEGRLLSSTLLSVLVTTDGRVLAGAVPPEALQAAAR